MSIHLRFEKERMTIRKQVDYIVPERLEEARVFRGMTTREIAEEMGKEIGDVFTGVKSIDDGLKAMNDSTYKIFQRSGRYE